MKIQIKISGPQCSGKSILARELGAYLDRLDIKVSGEGAEKCDPHAIEAAIQYDPALEIEIVTEQTP